MMPRKQHSWASGLDKTLTGFGNEGVGMAQRRSRAQSRGVEPKGLADVGSANWMTLDGWFSRQ